MAGQLKEQVLMKIYIGESDKFEGKPLHHALVDLFRTEKIAGATILRGVLGYFAESEVHTIHILRCSQDLPFVIEVVDTQENIDRILPKVDAMMQEGLITFHTVSAITYSKNHKT